MKPNPPPDPSSLPDSVLDLRIRPNYKDALTAEELEAITLFRRTGDYMAAAMIYLSQNTLLENDLQKEHIKPRLLGHWGTCPGLTLIYAHLNLAIRRQDLDMLLIVGPGHGAPSILACLWMEDSLHQFYPDLPRDKSGADKLIANFSTPAGFPSHVGAQFPGSIHEGGELGYALAVAYGAAMDSPDLIVTCIVGDGEAETGPTAAAWHAHKYMDPAESGAVLPILHANGFKIAERTIFGTMDNKEIVSLFTGYGYQVCIVEDLENIDRELTAAIQWAVAEIRAIQTAARSGQPQVKPRWPMIVLRTPKGLSGPKFLNGQPIEGSYKAHQVPMDKPTKDQEQFDVLKAWLESYKPTELFDNHGKPSSLVDKILIHPDPTKRLGGRKEAYDAYQTLEIPDWKAFSKPKGEEISATSVVGQYLAEVFQKNPKTTRLWSPDELTSNKLNAVLDVTSRNFQSDPDTRAKGGRVIEILSEHTCQGMLQGYTLTGRTGFFPSYESFLGIIHTMMVQYSKFCKMARETKWRKDIGSLNYLETSTWTRQEHNGFSHQNPSFIGAVLNLKAQYARVYLPPDVNCMISTVAHCLDAKNYINLIVGSKQPTPVWLSPKEAEEHCRLGASIWKFASIDEGKNPDVVLVGIGVEITFEVIAAAALLRQLAPSLRVRVVNVTDLMVLGPEGSHPHALSDEAFADLFTRDKGVHFNYHGYAVEIKGLLFGRPGTGERITVQGYQEEGTTTTPFAMLSVNRVSRYHVAITAIEAGRKTNKEVAAKYNDLLEDLKKRINDHQDYIQKHGKDPDGIYDTPQF